MEFSCRVYERSAAAVFFRVQERFGALSNMRGGFPLAVNGLLVRSSEALYQACRYPDHPDVQAVILAQTSPMAAKMKSKPHRKTLTRADWDAIQVEVMRWCLRVKLCQHWQALGAVLRATGDLPIVEQSRKDDFWGAKALDDERLAGRNVLGQLLDELRAVHRAAVTPLEAVAPPVIADFLLLGQPIGLVRANDNAGFLEHAA